ncbi:MAG TPA: DUF5989 family protein [Candidatus Hydrogenedentes bacterium]|nr:DUF5989 family protein [Candidatus Hydrogenedentota bacterium]HOL78255.1 DUF5989 family protein [Candidatus Hydrogenedentota bacterium]HPO86395.1 DUF5989 family protein [Candidatus Hydrogenedentota bacterium]
MKTDLNSTPKDPNIVTELWQFLRAKKRYWLAPIIFALLFLGFLILATGSSGILSPFLYAL